MISGHTMFPNSITILKLVINLISSSISIIRVLAFVELINRINKNVNFPISSRYHLSHTTTSRPLLCCLPNKFQSNLQGQQNHIQTIRSLSSS
jgi:hypothetical protein